MYRILILLLSSVIANLVYSAEVFFDKKLMCAEKTGGFNLVN